MRRSTFFALILAPTLPVLLGAMTTPNQPVIEPTIPTANRDVPNRIFLERADSLKKNATDSFLTLIGDVIFTKGGMTMYCDSCHYFVESESLDAFGNVKMEQGDTLFIYADELNYDGFEELATLYGYNGKKVRMINRDVTLTTDIFNYNLAIDLGYYDVGGTLTDPSNTLTSIKGEYVPSTKEANFYLDVHLNAPNKGDTVNIYSDTLYYNTGTHIAELYSYSEIHNSRGIVQTTLGIYDSDSDITTLYNRSSIHTSEDQQLTADTIYYDRNAGYGEAFGNMVLIDNNHKAEIRGDYGYYDEFADSSFVTGKAMLLEYSKNDTLYLHARYIQSFRRIDSIFIAEDTIAKTPASSRMDTTHIAVAFPRARFYRSDMQGVADSIRFTQEDSTLRMFVNPIVWNENRQIHGNQIHLKLNDSTIERATLPDQGFTAQHIEGNHYNQLSGKEMIAYFNNGEIRQLDINGSVEIILYPEENDSSINKIVNAQSSFLQAWFKGRTTEKVKMWPETTGTATPLFIAKKNIYFLPKFKWFESIRPISKEDIFIIPDEMERLMVEAGHPVREIPYLRKARLLSISPVENESTEANIVDENISAIEPANVNEPATGPPTNSLEP